MGYVIPVFKNYDVTIIECKDDADSYCTLDGFRSEVQ